MRPICVKCKKEYQCKKNEQLVNDKAVGGFPATYWSGDLWKCPQCGHEVVTGRGRALTHLQVDGNHGDEPLWGGSIEFEHC